MCLELGANHRRRGDNSHRKAGNMNATFWDPMKLPDPFVQGRRQPDGDMRGTIKVFGRYTSAQAQKPSAETGQPHWSKSTSNCKFTNA